MNGGDFVLVWTDYDGRDGNTFGVFANIYDASGTALSNDFQVNTLFLGNQWNPSITKLSDGFFITWTGVLDATVSPHTSDIFAQRYELAKSTYSYGLANGTAGGYAIDASTRISSGGFESRLELGARA